jgi:hypothetical protein
LDFRHIHIYQDSVSAIDANFVSSNVASIFPSCSVEVRGAFEKYWGADNLAQECEYARILDVKQPFEKQPKPDTGAALLYDGFVLQTLFRSAISDAELGSEHVHIIMTDRLTCTFDEDDWRYHARPVICGIPSIVSSAGIVEGPARPKEYYFMARPGFAGSDSAMKEFQGRFIDYGDPRASSAALEYCLQAIFFFIADGVPFCENRKCRLFNAHWQEDLVAVINNPTFCESHMQLLNKFNAARQD